MEEDAGADRLTPPRSVGTSPAVAVCDSAKSQPAADAPDTQATGEAPTGRTVASAVSDAEDGGADAATAPEPTDAAGVAPAAASSSASRLSGRPLRATAVALVLLAGTTAAGGYLALRAHRDTQAMTRANAAAVAVAKDCVAATQPHDAAALPASQQKLSECSTGNFGAQVAWYDVVMAEAYRAVNVNVQVSTMRGAVERDNADGSIVVLLAFRTTVSQAGIADRENGYRLRVKMVSEGGQFKVAELNQVAK